MDWKRVTINTTEEGLDLVGYKLSEIGITQYELVEDAASTQKILDETSAYWDYVDAEAVLAARQPCVRVYLTENAVGEEQLSALRAAVEELKGVAVNADGQATDADLAASVTLSITDFIAGIERAVNNAEHLGARKGDKLALTSVTNMAKSKDASAEGDGLAQAYATVAAVTLNGDTVTSCFIDAVQANVKFDAAGKITTDLTAAQPSKNELGDAYGMKKASSIGKEWYEQAAAFSAYVTGKTVSEVSGIAVDDHESPTDADLAASVTIGIGEFQTLIEKAAV